MGQPFLPPYLSKSVVEAEAESFSLSAPGRNPQGVCHILPVSALGSVVALKRCFHSPRSLLQCLLPYSYHLLKVIIFLFLIPGLLASRGILSVGRALTSVGSNPTDPTPAVPVCAGCQGTPQQRAPTLQRCFIQAGKTH